MAVLLKRDSELASLRLSMDRSESTSRVLFEVQHRGERTDRRHADVSEMGIPLTLEAARAYREREPTIRIPEWILAWLDEVVQGVVPSGQPLWLELASPHGNLPMVPWERILSERLRVPLLRIPYYALPPTPTSGSLDIALCVSSPVAKSPIPVERVLGDLVDGILEAVPRQTVVHIFADFKMQDVLKAMFRGREATATRSGVSIHDPRAAPPIDPEAEDRPREFERAHQLSRAPEAATDIDNVWLRWMLQALAPATVDAVHFLCHGYLSLDQGALAMAESPMKNRDRRSARFVGTRQLIAFLTRTGTATVSFSSPPHNYSALGMRLMHHQVALARPGATLLHDLNEDRHCAALTRSLALLFGARSVPDHPEPGISLYCHPRVAGLEPVASQAEADRITEEYTVAKAEIAPILQGESAAPAWLVSSQRYLELSAAQLLEDETQFPEQFGRRRGVENAMRFVSDVLRRHAIASVQESYGGDQGKHEPMITNPAMSQDAPFERDTNPNVPRRQTGADESEERSL